MPPHRPDPLSYLSRLGEQPLALAQGALGRLVAMQFVERSVALGSLAFTALLPLLVIAAAFLPGTEGLANELIHRFHLTGSSATLVRQVFTRPDPEQQVLSWLGAALLVGSALSFTRALQRVYEQAWRMAPRGLRGSLSGLAWIAGIVLWSTVFAAARRWLLDRTGPIGTLVILLGGNALLWLWTPWILLGRRVTWFRLLPSALLTSIAMTVLSAASVVWMPHAIESSSLRYGPIGVAIALVSWLVGVGFALVVCAAVGAVLGAQLRLAGEPPRD